MLIITESKNTVRITQPQNYNFGGTRIVENLTMAQNENSHAKN